MSDPSAADIQTWLGNVHPCCVRDDSLWGYAYAAVYGQLPQTLGDFQAFQHTVYTVAGSIGWDGDFILGYAQQAGHMPDLSTPAMTDDFRGYLNRIGARKPDGSPTGAGYPRGGTGYPPSGGTGTGTGSGTGSGTGTGSGDSLSGVLDWVKKNPVLAGVGAVAGLLLLRR